MNTEFFILIVLFSVFIVVCWKLGSQGVTLSADSMAYTVIDGLIRDGCAEVLRDWANANFDDSYLRAVSPYAYHMMRNSGLLPATEMTKSAVYART